jgi:hypothetical protein
MWVRTATIAVDTGADLVMGGIGGDDIFDYEQLIVDRLRHGSIRQRLRDARAAAAWAPDRFRAAITGGLKDAIPESLEGPLRTVLRRRGDRSENLIRADVWASLSEASLCRFPVDFDFPTYTQVASVAAVLRPSISWLNEVQEAEYASAGVDLTQPYLDRSVIEFVASIPVSDQPVDGRTKPFIRRGFANYLPSSVLNRRTKTVAEDYLDHMFVSHASAYRERYPVLLPPAEEFLDADRYLDLLCCVDMGQVDFSTRESLWSAWTVMAWLEGLDRYRKNPGPTNLSDNLFVI